MENLIFSLNATVPVFAMIILGMLFKKIGIIDDVFASKMNKFVFLIPLPVLLFKDLATLDFKEIWDTKFVLFCFFITIFSILIVTILSFLLSVCLFSLYRSVNRIASVLDMSLARIGEL